MTPIILNVEKVKNRGNKFGIVYGSKILQRFKTKELAISALDEKRSFYEYWAGSVSVTVDKSKKIEIII